MDLRTRRIVAAIIAGGLLLLVWKARQTAAADESSACAAAVSWDGTIQLAFGLTATAPREWQGSLRATRGEVAAMWGWHFLPPDRVFDGGHFRFTARLFDDRSAKY